MATTPTNLPVPSESPRDLKFNAGKIDEFVTSLALQYIDRFGNAHYTIEGLRWLAQQAISQYGWVPIGTFQEGATLTLPNQILKDTSDGEYYRWDGSFLPSGKDVPSGSTPSSSGGVGVGAWISVGDSSLRSMLSSYTGFVHIGGIRGQVKTSEAGSLEQAIISALENNADVLVDNAQNITAPIRKSLNGRDISITSTADGWINFTPTDANTYYQILTFDGTGVESVTTKVKIDGGKVRGVGRAVVGVTVNNVYAHYESSEMRNISACVNTVTAQIHLCHGAKYYNVFQQLASQDWSAGVYGYGTVPIDCELVSVDSCIFGVSGAPLDRHAVYCSSLNDGTGSNRNVFVTGNTATMRDYRTESPETTFERCFKFIGSKKVLLTGNTVVGGYGFALFTFRKDQNCDFFKVSNNSASIFGPAIQVTYQDEAAAASDATWYMSELSLSDNDMVMTSNTAGIGVGVRYMNTYRVRDIGSKYRNQSYATVNALAVYFGDSSRIQAESLEAITIYYQGIQNVLRGQAAINTAIDASCRNAVASSSPYGLLTDTSIIDVRIRSLDNTGAWKSGVTGTAIIGFSYLDPTYGRYITNIGAGAWVDDRGYRVVGVSTSRPTGVPTGHRFYQTDAATYVIWTGSLWVLATAGYSGIISSGTTSQINSVAKTLLGYGHTIYNTDTKKPVFFDQLAQAWKYSDGTAM